MEFTRSVASFTLPPSPTTSPPPPPPPPTSLSSDEIPAFPLVLWDDNDHHSKDHHSLPTSSSSSFALVPFHKLQLDTNLHETTLPYKNQDLCTSRLRTKATSLCSNVADTRHKITTPTSTNSINPLTCNLLNNMDIETRTSRSEVAATTRILSSEFMNALGLGEVHLQEEEEEEAQLSVRVRGNRVELASVSDEQEVDFLGPAENIKTLFKLPYSQSKVSLAVHRVGTTLVVDGELNENDLPPGFEDLPQETLQLIQPSDDTKTHKLLYEKFIYESTVNRSLPGFDKERLELTKEKREEKKTGNRTSKKKYAKKAKKNKKQKHKTEEVLEPVVGQKTQTQKSSEHSEMVSAIHNDDNREMSIPVPSPLVPGGDSSLATNTESHSGDNTQHEVGSSSSNRPKSCPPFIPTDMNWFASAGQRSPAYGDSHTFERILKWKFNDLKMILGSQVLLFSNQEHPAVSLKLHDMDKELSLCTVLDYYLDNVISNIPELAICMHSKGFVRGYKLVETRQIPYMSDSGRPLFDVQDVSMNASMLLKFLQENCSRPNGTYWLHRKEGETSLRLYDVDVLSQGSQLKWKYMMAMLCYRFAARASRLANSIAAGTPHLQQQLQQRQRELLRTCMSLLGEIAQKGGVAHSSICSSVSEQLADTYIRECNQFHSSSSSADLASEDLDREAAIGSLEKAKQYLLASIILFEECITKDSDPALTHNDDRTDGTSTMEDKGELAPEAGAEESEMGSFMDEELNRLQLKFSSACVELGRLYARSQKWIVAVKCIVEASQFLTLSSIPGDVQPHDLTSCEQDVAFDLLLDKLDFDGVGRGGFSQDKITICASGSELRCSLLNLIGDIAAQTPVTVYSGLTALFEIISGAKRDQLSSVRENASEWSKTVDEDDMSLDAKTLASREENLLMLSFLAYLHALLPPVDSELFFMMMRKLGNASNELGKYFLAVKCNYKEAFRWFERGCKIFNDIEDGVNVALIRANLAHLHKIFAQGKSAEAREEHYQTAIQLCTEALHLLKQSKADADLNRKVKGELALTYLVWAVDLANNISSLEDAKRCPMRVRENEVLKMFNKALTLYTELNDSKQTASTHYQIASFYSRMISRTLRTERLNAEADTFDGSSSTVTSRMEIARRHYEKALHYFGAVEVGKTFVLIHQELADLHLLGGHFEGIEHALLILLSTFEAFNVASSRDSKLEQEEMTSLACDIVAKVKTVLHQLIRLCSFGHLSSLTSVHTRNKKLEMFKNMYKEMIYSDGYSTDSNVPVLNTLRSMYSL